MSKNESLEKWRESKNKMKLRACSISKFHNYPSLSIMNHLNKRLWLFFIIFIHFILPFYVTLHP